MKTYSNPIDVKEVKQKNSVFFLGRMTPETLHKISNKHLSKYENLEKGIQRRIDPRKVKEIKEYLADDKSAVFPNTIILAIQDGLNEEESAYRFTQEGKLEILLEDDVANVIDGQHRLSGLEKDDTEFEMPVSIFLNMSLGDQAVLFAKINSTQTKVTSDLIYELFDMSDKRSEEKIAYYLVKNLNSDADSPWNGLIKTLSDRTGHLAQGSMAKFFHKELLSSGKVFHELYKNEKDAIIYLMLRNYYTAVKNVFSEYWGSDNYIINKTTGFVGFAKFFILLAKKGKEEGVDLTIDYFESFLRNAKMNVGSLDSTAYPSGAVGQSDIYAKLCTSLTK